MKKMKIFTKVFNVIRKIFGVIRKIFGVIRKIFGVIRKIFGVIFGVISKICKFIKNLFTTSIDIYSNIISGSYNSLKEYSILEWIVAIILFLPIFYITMFIGVIWMIYVICTGFWEDSSDFTKVLLAIFFWNKK